MKPKPLFALIPFFFILGIALSIGRDIFIGWDLDPEETNYIWTDQNGTTRTGLIYTVQHAAIAPVNFTNILTITNAAKNVTNLLSDGEAVETVVVQISNLSSNMPHFFTVFRTDPASGLSSSNSRIIALPAYRVVLDNGLRILPPMPPVQP